MSVRDDFPKKNEWVVCKDFDKHRLDYWLKKKISFLPYTAICKLLRKGTVRVNGKRARNSNLLSSGDIIRFSREIKGPDELKKVDKYGQKFGEYIKSLVIFKNKQVLVLNKPKGLAVQGGTKIKLNIDLMLDSLKYDFQERPKLVHRIDKQTSGILLIARSLGSSKYIGKLFKEHAIVKTYIAVVHGTPKNKYGKIELKIKQNHKLLESVTYFKVLKKVKDFSLLIIRPITGRKHQIRIHMNHIGNPILGDTKFSSKKNDEFKSLHLHAYQISYRDQSGTIQNFCAPLPDHFVSTFNKLKINPNIEDNLEFKNLEKYKFENEF